MSSTHCNERFAFDLTGLCFSVGCAGGGILAPCTPRSPSSPPLLTICTAQDGAVVGRATCVLAGVPMPCCRPLSPPSWRDSPWWEHLKGMFSRQPPQLPILAFPKQQGRPRCSPLCFGGCPAPSCPAPRAVRAHLVLPGSGQGKLATWL